MSRELRLPAGRVQRGVLPAPDCPIRWGLSELAGRLTELAQVPSSAALTLCFGLVLDAQWQGQPSAWISAGGSLFFPPDVAEGGVDLDALPVIRVPDATAAARTAEALLRSGAFGLIVLDLGNEPVLSTPLQARLIKLAQRHETALVSLTCSQDGHGSLGPLVSLRAQAHRQRCGQDRYRCELRVLKDKRRGPHWTHQELCQGPPGLP